MKKVWKNSSQSQGILAKKNCSGWIKWISVNFIWKRLDALTSFYGRPQVEHPPLHRELFEIFQTKDSNYDTKDLLNKIGVDWVRLLTQQSMYQSCILAFISDKHGCQLLVYRCMYNTVHSAKSLTVLYYELWALFTLVKLRLVEGLCHSGVWVCLKL